MSRFASSWFTRRLAAAAVVVHACAMTLTAQSVYPTGTTIYDSPARGAATRCCRRCFLADQLGTSDDGVLKRYDRKPKRLASRKLYMLQGLPDVGPALAHRLLLEFGCVERVLTADEETLMRVRGIGPEKAARIRQGMR